MIHPDDPEDDGADFSGCGAVEYKPSDRNPMDRSIELAKQKAWTYPFVEGVGLGRDSQGNQIIKVYLRELQGLRSLPDNIGGWQVIGQVVGEINLR